ncbi:MAG TPA: hypothetical protein VK576_05165 [Thermoleophilia bacterium]|nr:hypothetical protein [Thermoleophilia bacterium]
MCYGYKGYSARWWEEDADQRRRIEYERQRQERVERQEREFERERREVLRARQNEQLRRLEQELIDAESDVETPARQR